MTRLLVALVLLVLGAAPAGAAPSARSAGPCTGSGVTVVVDYHGLGGGIDQRCDTGGANRSADTVFGDVGINLTYVQRQPGFVCQVQSKPGDAGCVNTPPANAYWGLYWSDGKGGGWTYATTGVGGLEVPDGGSVAFAWQSSSASDPPGVAPRRAAVSKPTATTRPTPTRRPTRSASPTPAAPAAPTKSAPAAAPSSSAVPTPSDTSSAPTPTATSASPSTTPVPTTASATSEPSATAAGTTTSAPSDPSGGGLPWWLPVGLVVVLASAGLGTVVWRRRGA